MLFRSAIPSSLGALGALKSLGLRENQLSGEIPTLKVSGVSDSFADILGKGCIDDHGRVTSVKFAKALPEITEELQRIIGGWRYKPWVNAAGTASPVCFPLTFRVVFKHSS